MVARQQLYHCTRAPLLGYFTFFSSAVLNMLDKVAWTSGSFLLGRGSTEESAGLMSSLWLSFSTAVLAICCKFRMQNKLLYKQIESELLPKFAKKYSQILI
jgi:hypothetical protein